MFTCSSNDEEICEGIFAFYKRGFFSGGGGAPQLITEAYLTTSAILNRGTVFPDFTRATAASLLDFENLMKDAISGEIRFSGARRVHNLVPNSSDFTDGWSIVELGDGDVTDNPDGSYTCYTASSGRAYKFFQQSVSSGKDYLSVLNVSSVVDQPNATIFDLGAVTDTRTPLLVNPTTAGIYYSKFEVTSSGTGQFRHGIGAGGTNSNQAELTIDTAQVEEVTGQSDQNPASFVSLGTLSLPYHGAGVDGVKNFDRQNGNTVDGAGKVTEATGSPISESLLLGYLCEIGRTNLALYSLDFGNAAWVTSNLSVTTDQLVGKKGLTDADVLTADAANATILQTISSASANRVFTLWLKRKTGTGNIDLTIDNGVTWQNITDDISSLVRVEIKQSAVTNPVFGVRIVTSGDEVYAWGANLENGDFATSFVETAATAVSRNPDQLSYPNDSYKFLPNEFTFAFTVRPVTSGANYANGEIRLFGTDDSSGDAYEIRTTGSTSYSYIHVTGGGFFTINKSDLVGDQNARFLFSLSQEGSDVRAIVYKDGVEKLNTTTAGTLNHSDTSVGIGHYVGNYFSGNFKNIKIWSGKLADAKLISESTL